MMRTNKNPPTTTKPSSIKTRFAINFLRAMRKLNNNNRPYNNSSSQSTMSEKQKRYQAIRAASHASMAAAVGPRRAWSRAVLRKIRNQRRRNFLRRHRNGIFLMRGNPRDDRLQEDGCLGFGGEEEEDLRELVPGGEGMDFCRLLNETAHYIKCLRAQVQVMTNILDHCSS